MRRRRLISSQLLVAALSVSALVLPAAPAGAQPLETVTVPANSSTGGTSSAVLNAGTTYLFEASGTGSYGFQNGQFDVECSTLPPDPTWQRGRFLLLDPESDVLDVLVNGENVEWQATSPDAFGCNSTSHAYTFTFTPDTTGVVNFRVHDPGLDKSSHLDNNGGFFIEIIEAAETLLETLTVPTADFDGVNSTVSLDPAFFYRIKASGTGIYDAPRGSELDAECTTFTPDPTWQPNRWVVLDAQEDLVDLYLNKQNVAWQADEPDLLGCNSTGHTYQVIFQPTSAGTVNFGIKDTNYADNGGALTVRIFRLEFPPPQARGPLSPPDISLTEQFEVDSADSDGTTSVIPFRAGDSHLIEVVGTFAYGKGTADARCSTVTPGTTFFPSEDNYPAFPPGTLQLVVDQQVVPWAPTSPDSGEPDCNSADHTYRLMYVPSQSGLVNFRILDGNYTDNGGVLTVKIFRVREIPVGRVLVNSASPSGTPTPPLLQGRTYRLRGSGTYTYFQNVPGTFADTECSQADFPPFSSPLFERHRWGTGDGDLLDIFVNDGNVDWLTAAGSSTDCDLDHIFDHTLGASSTGPINLKIKDVNYGDNSGSVPVDIFLQAS